MIGRNDEQLGMDYAPKPPPDVPPGRARFDGDPETCEPEPDRTRLNRKLQYVFDVMKDGTARTDTELLQECARRWPDVQFNESGCGARRRDLRKTRFGGYDVIRAKRSEGVYEYRLDLTERGQS